MKSTQEVINNLAMREWDIAMHYLNACTINEIGVTRLRYCSAVVLWTPRYFYLKSFNTIVACINRNTGVKIDMLRYVYGYTATSAQHISKFFNDYEISLSYPAKRYTYKPA